MDKISEHVTYLEATDSNTAKRAGLKNIPNEKQLNNMVQLAEKIIEPARVGIGNKPIKINSFFRGYLVNRHVGGSITSQHCEGEAVDLSCFDNKLLFDFIKNNLDFDQLIWEYGNDSSPDWVHVSYKSKNNRKQILRAVKNGSQAKYIKI
jgi:zinc D-Ala-D-Ala carboxypeptidase